MGWTSYKEYQLSKIQESQWYCESDEDEYGQVLDKVPKMRPYKNTWKAILIFLIPHISRKLNFKGLQWFSYQTVQDNAPIKDACLLWLT